TTAQTPMDRDAPVALVDESMATSVTMSNSNITIHLAETGSSNSSSSDGSSGYPSQSESSKCLADSSVIKSSDDASLHSDPCTPLPLQLNDPTASSLTCSCGAREGGITEELFKTASIRALLSALGALLQNA
ncbi:unnamed protein product, partial [Lampetra planeri]